MKLKSLFKRNQSNNYVNVWVDVPAFYEKCYTLTNIIFISVFKNYGCCGR